MRKLWIAVLALAAVVAVAGVAVAANTYTVHLAEVTPGKGTMKRPIPAALDFGYQVGDTENMRPFVIREYRIAAEGTRSYPDARPKCTFDAATDPSAVTPAALSAACRRAFVGTGTINNLAGAPNDRSQKLPCNVKLTLINISTGDPRFPKPRCRRSGSAAASRSASTRIRPTARFRCTRRSPPRSTTRRSRGFPPRSSVSRCRIRSRIRAGSTTRSSRSPRSSRRRPARSWSGGASRRPRQAEGRLLLARRPQGWDAHGARDLRGRVGREVNRYDDGEDQVALGVRANSFRGAAYGPPLLRSAREPEQELGRDPDLDRRGGQQRSGSRWPR